MTKTVYHATAKGNGQRISDTGWVVSYAGTNIYGRGIYFWELLKDAHTYGEAYYGNNNYDIVSENIPVASSNSVVYDHNKARNSNIDTIAQGLLARGIDVVVISNPQIEATTLTSARGKAFLWLVDMRDPTRVVKY